MGAIALLVFYVNNVAGPLIPTFSWGRVLRVPRQQSSHVWTASFSFSSRSRTVTMPAFRRRKLRNHFGRYRFAFNFLRVCCRNAGPYSDFRALHGQDFFIEQFVLDAKTAAAPLADLGLDDYDIRHPRWHHKGCSNVDEWDSDDLIVLQHLPLWQTGLQEQSGRACVEVGEVAREVNNLRRITIAPLYAYGFPAYNFLFLAQRSLLHWIPFDSARQTGGLELNDDKWFLHPEVIADCNLGSEICFF